MEQIDGYAVGWGTPTLINAGIAQRKGRSGLWWWVASVFLGPIATFLIAILSRVEPTRPDTGADVEPPTHPLA